MLGDQIETSALSDAAKSQDRNRGLARSSRVPQRGLPRDPAGGNVAPGTSARAEVSESRKRLAEMNQGAHATSPSHDPARANGSRTRSPTQQNCPCRGSTGAPIFNSIEPNRTSVELLSIRRFQVRFLAGASPEGLQSQRRTTGTAPLP